MLRTSLLLLITCACSFATPTIVLFDLEEFNASPTTNRTVTLQALSPFPGNLVSYTSDTNGTFTVTNPAVGDYVGEIKKKGTSSAIPFQITVVSTNLGTVNAHEIFSVGGIQSYPEAGRSAWSIAASDARYGLGAAGVDSINGIDGQAVVLAATNQGSVFNFVMTTNESTLTYTMTINTNLLTPAQTEALIAVLGTSATNHAIEVVAAFSNYVSASIETRLPKTNGEYQGVLKGTNNFNIQTWNPFMLVWNIFDFHIGNEDENAGGTTNSVVRLLNFSPTDFAKDQANMNSESAIAIHSSIARDSETLAAITAASNTLVMRLSANGITNGFSIITTNIAGNTNDIAVSVTGTNIVLTHTWTNASGGAVSTNFSMINITGDAHVGGDLDIDGTIRADEISVGTIELTNALGTASGGTGKSSVTAGRLLSGNGTSALDEVILGTGLSFSGSAGSTRTLNASAGTGTLSNVVGSDFVFYTLPVTTAPTNFTVNFTNGVYQNILATNDVNITLSGIGSASVKITSVGTTNRLITFPTNGFTLGTNNLTLLGARWSFTLTNGYAAWLSFVKETADSSNNVSSVMSDQWNRMVSSGSQTPLTQDVNGASTNSITNVLNFSGGGTATTAAKINGVKVYSAFLSQATTSSVSGSLIVGELYRIDVVESGDDFSNVGLVNPVQEFVATGTTPTSWANGTEVFHLQNPVATVMENTLGGTVVWQRVEGLPGNYTGTLASAFTANKTSNDSQSWAVGSSLNVVNWNRTDNNTISLKSFSQAAGDFSDDLLSDTFVEIRVFP
jgi:hypothetical protein